MQELTLDLTVASAAPPVVESEPEERPIRLSYSAISTYELCPLQYKFRYVDREPGARTPALAFGESLHEALRRFYHQPVPVAPTLGQLLGFLEDAWESAPYADAREEGQYLDHGRQVLAQFHRTHAGSFRLPAALEQRFAIDVEGVALTGIIDRMDRHPDGSYEIIDYKTNRRLPPRRIVERDLQLSIYYLAAQEVWGITPSRLTLYYLLPGQAVTVSRTAEDAEDTRARIAGVAAAIKAKTFPPRENRLCNWCDYQARCPLFGHAAAREQQPDPAEVAAAIREWITLAQRTRADAVRLEELEPTIMKHLEATGWSRLHTEDAAITLAERREPLYDASALDALLANGLPDDVRAALRAARSERTVTALELTDPS